MALSTTQYGYIVDPMVPFTDASGTAIKNGYIRVFLTGTSTPVLTYANYDGATNEETIELDSAGRCVNGVIGSKGLTYKVCVYDAESSQENPILTIDKIAPFGATITAGTGATVVTGLDSVTTKANGWIKATVSGTSVNVEMDATNVTNSMTTEAQVESNKNDFCIPALSNDNADQDDKIPLSYFAKIRDELNKAIESLSINFSTSVAYPVGVLCTYEGQLYRFTAAKAAGDWDASKVEEIGVDELLEELGASIAPQFAAANSYSAGELVTLGTKLYRFTADHPAGAWTGSDAVEVSVIGEFGNAVKYTAYYDSDTSQIVFPDINSVLSSIATTENILILYTNPSGLVDVLRLDTYDTNSKVSFVNTYNKHNFVATESGGSWSWADESTELVVDSSLDLDSTNPVQNSVVAGQIWLMGIAHGQLSDSVDYIKGSIADTYDDSSTYSVGDYVMYEDELYICNTAVSTAEEWDSTKWTQTDVVTQLGTKADIFTDNGSKTESDITDGRFIIETGNSTTKLTLTSISTLTILSNWGAPNFALTIDNSGNANDVTLSVKTIDETTTLYHSTAGGTSVGAGKIAQVTAVGDCWTIAEVEA